MVDRKVDIATMRAQEQIVLDYMRLSIGERTAAVCRMLDRGVLVIGKHLELREPRKDDK